MVFSYIYICGLLLLLLTSLPVAIENGAALGGLVTAMTVVGLGTGGIKSNVSPLIAEQMTETRMKIKTTKSGERVIQDPSVTFQRIYMIFYFCINIGSLSLVATVFMEKYTGYWSVNLLGLLAFLIGFGVLLLGKKYYGKSCRGFNSEHMLFRHDSLIWAKLISKMYSHPASSRIYPAACLQSHVDRLR